jgi:cytochrome c2
MLGALALIWIGFHVYGAVFNGFGAFLTPRNLWNLSVQTSSIGIMACGMVLVIGRAAGAVEGFKYSKPLMAMAADGLIWDEANLQEFLASPKGFMKGTKMSFRGLKDAEEIAAVSAYLASFAD